MQLRKITGLNPVTIVAGLLIGNTVSSFAYNDVDMYSNVHSESINNHTSNHFKDVNGKSYTDFALKVSFERHLQSWQKQTKFLSSAKMIIQHKDFQAIVGMGYKATPLILNEIQKKPSLLVWTLNFIYNRKVTNTDKNITVEEACKLWLKTLKA